jgi:peptide/nickel transport system substrate-binding protein
MKTLGSSKAPTGKPKPGGVLRVGIGGGSSSENFDAALVNGPAATTRDQVFYENLIWMDGTFGLENALCEEITPNKTHDQWTVKLKPEVEFHNGKTLTADDVLFTMQRILDPKVGATASGQYLNVLAQTKKIDSHTVRFDLHYPNISFPALLSDVTYIIPVGYDPRIRSAPGPGNSRAIPRGSRRCWNGSTTTGARRRWRKN